jgi:hypothetical protein
MNRICRASILGAFALSLLLGQSLLAANDNALTPSEKAEGWQLLFNGDNYAGWQMANPRSVEDGSMQIHLESNHYLYYAPDTFRNFVLELDVKQSSESANSGVFFRVANPHEPLATGYECQIAGGGTMGSLYDLVPTDKDVQKPAGEWNHVKIRCVGPKITVWVNGTQTAQMDTRRWTEVGERPDGTEHKFTSRPIADFPQEGHIMLQDHGYKVWYKNIKVLELNDDGEPK